MSNQLQSVSVRRYQTLALPVLHVQYVMNIVLRHNSLNSREVLFEEVPGSDIVMSRTTHNQDN